MTTTRTPNNQAVADGIVAMIDGLATGTPGPIVVERLSVYFSTAACNRRGGWVASAKVGAGFRQVELRSATDQKSADRAAAAHFVVAQEAAA